MTNSNETTSTRPRGGAHWRSRGIILIAVAASAWALWFLTTRSLERQVIWTDYALFHATVNRWLDGQAMYGRGIAMVGAPRITESVNFNPPQFHLLVLPLARLGLRPGLLLWQALSNRRRALLRRRRRTNIAAALRRDAGGDRDRPRAEQRRALEHDVVRTDLALPRGPGHAGVAGTDTLSVTLFAMILFAGVGSVLSDRLALSSRAARALPLVAAAAILLTAASVGAITAATIHLGLATRTAIVVAVLAPVATLLGFFFPLGLRLVASLSPAATPWMWGVNGACGVLGSIVAVGISMWIGIQVNLAVAALLYAGIFLIVGVLRGRAWPTR